MNEERYKYEIKKKECITESIKGSVDALIGGTIITGTTLLLRSDIGLLSIPVVLCGAVIMTIVGSLSYTHINNARKNYIEAKQLKLK